MGKTTQLLDGGAGIGNPGNPESAFLIIPLHCLLLVKKARTYERMNERSPVSPKGEIVGGATPGTS